VASHCDVEHRINTHHDQKALEQQWYLWAAARRVASPLQHYQDNTHQQTATILTSATSWHFLRAFLKKMKACLEYQKMKQVALAFGKERKTSTADYRKSGVFGIYFPFIVTIIISVFVPGAKTE
jgi:hypothetical protein